MNHSDRLWKGHAGPKQSGTTYDPERHGPRRIVGPGFRERVYDVVRGVPAGSVTTYGDVAGRLGMRSVARHVGFALAALPSGRRDVPWHRVVNARGQVSARTADGAESEQAARLAADGVPLDEKGRIVDFSLRRHAFED